MINIILAVTIGNLLCFLMGMKSVSKPEEKEEKKPVTLNPIKAVKKSMKEAADLKEAERQIEEFNIMLKNIDNYDGTSVGQEEV